MHAHLDLHPIGVLVQDGERSQALELRNKEGRQKDLTAKQALMCFTKCTFPPLLTELLVRCKFVVPPVPSIASYLCAELISPVALQRLPGLGVVLQQLAQGLGQRGTLAHTNHRSVPPPLACAARRSAKERPAAAAAPLHTTVPTATGDTGR